MRSPTGAFIVFEGGDGVGKSTQVDRLCVWLTERGHHVVRTFEPGDSAVGAAIRRIVLDPATGEMAPRAEALLYAADKAQHLYAVVEPALRDPSAAAPSALGLGWSRILLVGVVRQEGGHEIEQVRHGHLHALLGQNGVDLGLEP